MLEEPDILHERLQIGIKAPHRKSSHPLIMSFSTLSLKIQFQDSDGKLLTKDIKCNTLSSTLSLKIEAATLFGLQNHHKYALL